MKINTRKFELPMMEMDLCRFTYNPKSGTLVSEMSAFGTVDEGRWWLQHLYNDSSDTGIAILSNKTGKVVRFVLSAIDRDERENEVIGLRFKPVKPGEAGKVKEVILIND